MLAAKPGQVTFNAVYYGPDNPPASGRLAMMVGEGNGIFLDTNANPTGKSFKIEDVINLPGEECQY